MKRKIYKCLEEILIGIGLVFLIIGVFLISIPVGFIFSGVSIISIGILITLLKYKGIIKWKGGD